MGVCWAGINQQEPVIVPNVHQFPGHIACDSRSQSEIVIPLRDAAQCPWDRLEAFIRGGNP